MTKKTIHQALIRRDGLTMTEAKERTNEALAEIEQVLANGGTLFQVEEIIQDELGLEPDYLDAILCDLI
mgnify:FL=1|tara:strand:- start:373 stop:579 length:207 start_codon:yes stop_codon:yes gene_type:complete